MTLLITDALPIIISVCIFIVTSVASGIVTYRLKVKKIRQTRKDKGDENAE